MPEATLSGNSQRRFIEQGDLDLSVALEICRQYLQHSSQARDLFMVVHDA